MPTVEHLDNQLTERLRLDDADLVPEIEISTANQPQVTIDVTNMRKDQQERSFGHKYAGRRIWGV